ncbi:STAS domain-containing protein [Streptomyces sp. NPDC015139]|uniref:STAS domain-containing protein n=1 Tax=Streptomyces sp. NPDC015139 TaxID=3364942 RepID=UPI0036FCCA38
MRVRLPEPLKIVTTATDQITVITVTGEIDRNSVGPLVQALAPRPLAGRPRVVVDMRRVSFMDSRGITILLAANRDLNRAGGWLRLAGVPHPILRILQLVGIDTVFDCRASLRDALTAS